MSEGFIGLSVLATLRDPPNAKVRGLVTNVVAGELTLITWLSDGSWSEILLVPGSNILDIEVEPDLILSPTPPVDVEVEPKQAFVDPAIVSYGKKGEADHRLPHDAHVESPRPWEPEAAAWAKSPPLNSSPVMTTVPINSYSTAATEQSETFHRIMLPKPQENTAASATLSEPFNDLSLGGPTRPAHGRDINDSNNHMTIQVQEPIGVTPPVSRNTRKRAKRGSIREGMVSTPTQTLHEPEVATPVSTQKRRGNNNRKGWRQTPLLEEPTLANIRLPRAHQAFTSPSPTLTLGIPVQTRPTPEPTKGKQRRMKEEEEHNGWATGEATDIQDMGDFDFEENHKKFDKRKVFDQIRRDDTTADEARLVSFNRLPSKRPGTGGGKNLHYTENVLDSPLTLNMLVDHSSGDSEVDISEARISSGRSLSRASTRRNIPSRKGSALINASLDRVASPKLKSDTTTSFRKSSTNQPKYSLLISSSKRSCPCITPLQMLEMEQLAITELDLTEDIMTENAARSVAEAAYGLASGEAPQSTSAPIVILAGNNKTGSRAIAASRHLRNHGTRTVLCILGLEREDDLLDSVRRQLKIFRNCGGHAIKQDALMRTLRKLQSPTGLIIDALLGIHVSFDDLRTDDEAAYFQLVCWANGSDADILALDVPSGIDASTGVSTFHDSTPLVINAQHVVSLGAPKTGLLSSLLDMDEETRPSLAVADIGISSVAWKKFGTRRRHGVEFGGVWLAPLEVQDGTQL